MSGAGRVTGWWIVWTLWIPLPFFGTRMITRNSKFWSKSMWIRGGFILRFCGLTFTSFNDRTVINSKVYPPALLYPLKLRHFNFRIDIWSSPVCKRLVFETSILSQNKLKKCAIVQCQACLKQPIAIPNPPISEPGSSINIWRIRTKCDSMISIC
jgi:hypothetical protein